MSRRQVTSIALTEREKSDLNEVARLLERTQSDTMRFLIRRAARDLGVQASAVETEMQRPPLRES